MTHKTIKLIPADKPSSPSIRLIALDTPIIYTKDTKKDIALISIVINGSEITSS